MQLLNIMPQPFLCLEKLLFALSSAHSTRFKCSYITWFNLQKQVLHTWKAAEESLCNSCTSRKLGYEYDYGDYNHNWDSMRRQHRWIVCLSTTVGSDDKIELKIKLKSPWECQWSSCTPQSREASPCLSNDVLLHRCSTGHQSSTGPGSEANREKNVKKKVQRGQVLKCLVTLLENFQKFNTPLSVGQILFANNFESAGSGRYCPRQHYLLSAMSSWILQLRWTKQPNYAVALEIPGTTTEARSGVLLER